MDRPPPSARGQRSPRPMVRAAPLATAAAVALLAAVPAAAVRQPAPGKPPAEVKKAERLDVQDRLTDNDPFDRVKTDCRCKIYPFAMGGKRAYTIDLRSGDF